MSIQSDLSYQVSTQSVLTIRSVLRMLKLSGEYSECFELSSQYSEPFKLSGEYSE